MRILISVILLFFPWYIRRRLLVWFYGYKLHPTSKIGLSFIYPRYLEMRAGASIGHFNVAIHLDKVIMGENSSIARGNWITGFPKGRKGGHFEHDENRRPELIIGKEVGITKNHHIDCTNSVKIGDYTTVAGYKSQFLSHSIDIYEGRQDSHPIVIGDYCFISTDVKILGGSALPSYSVLAAGAVLSKEYKDEWVVYGGVPAKPLKEIPKSAKYFSRKRGFVV